MPGPYTSVPYPSRYPGEFVVTLSRDLLGSARRMDDAGRHAGADVVTYGRGGPLSVVWLRHPDLVRALLIDENDGVVKGRATQLTRPLLGDGLLTSGGPGHARRRRLVLPAFRHGQVRAYGAVMAGQAREESDGWAEGERFDVGASMNRLALAVASRTLFGAEVDRDRVGGALAQALAAFERLQHPLAPVVLRLPFPATRRLRRARAAIDAEVFRVIGERRQSPGDGDDLLGLLLSARDEGTGEGLSDAEVRDEVVTLLLAGHETTAVALSWSWALLAQHPDAEARLWAEVDALGGDPTFDDLDRLPYARCVFAEAMRLYPPVWSFSREAARDLDLDGVRVRAGTTVGVGPLWLHRDARFWEDPGAFDPGRFAPERSGGRHKFAYVPFSAGRRGCVGEQFAWAEGALVLATVARRWLLRLGGAPPPPHGSATYRPSGPVWATPVRRG